MIKLTRVDYRLIHGQVAMSWTHALDVDCILCASDAVAKEVDFRSQPNTLSG